jgi:hypothetical protein
MVKPDLTLEVPDLSGRFAVVTGANSAWDSAWQKGWRPPVPMS